ncbi:MAG: sulfite exporter TauE/SafE family protein, partial [candidate division NC10 bacterium]|nr:sulfite exporter TauE/SafE family protein [candidate division NC10 bacterium]
GIGGGAVMTPLLILFVGVRPVIAVGTDLAYGAITKAVGALIHYRQKTVQLSIAGFLALGSVPASLLGVALLSWMKRRGGDVQVDAFVSHALGIVLIVVAVSLVARPHRSKKGSVEAGGLWERHPWRRTLLTILLGAGVGFLVGLTSVGSGSLIVAGMVILYPHLPLNRVVGTDIFHAALLVASAAMAHFRTGGVDLQLLQWLLVGSIPGVLLGSKLSIVFPERVLRPILAVALFSVGYKLL